MYQQIYSAYCRLSNGDTAALKRCNLGSLSINPSYYRVLKLTGLPDTPQVQRILFLLVGVQVAITDDSVPLADALHHAGVTEAHIVQIVRSGDNGLTYFKRQLIRCRNVQLESLGSLAQYWGENARRGLLKDFILSEGTALNNQAEQL